MCERNCIKDSNSRLTTVFCSCVNMAIEITHTDVIEVLKKSELECWSTERRRTAGASATTEHRLKLDKSGWEGKSDSREVERRSRCRERHNKCVVHWLKKSASLSKCTCKFSVSGKYKRAHYM